MFVFRQKCVMKGALTSKPSSCLLCNSSENELEDIRIQREHNIVLVVETGCSKSMYFAATKIVADIQAKMSIARNATVKFGVVSFGSFEPILHTISDGELFGGGSRVVELLQQISNMNDRSIESMGLEAAYLGSLYPFNRTAGRSVVLITCAKCKNTSRVRFILFVRFYLSNLCSG